MRVFLFCLFEAKSCLFVVDCLRLKVVCLLLILTPL